MGQINLNVEGYVTKSFKPGETIFHEGRPAGLVYVLKEGVVKVLSGGLEEETLNQPGTMLGEIAFMFKCNHTASVVAATDTKVHVIDDFLAYLTKNPESIREVCRVIQLRLMNSAQQGIENLPLDLRLIGCKMERFPSNTVIFEEGTPANKIYLLQNGTAKAVSSGHVIFRGNTPGTMFGEISNLIEGRYSISVIAVTECLFCVIHDVPEFFKTNPLASLQVSRVLAKRLDELLNQFTEFRAELFRSHLPKGNKKLSTKLKQFDELLKRDVMNPFSNQKTPPR